MYSVCSYERTEGLQTISFSLYDYALFTIHISVGHWMSNYLIDGTFIDMYNCIYCFIDMYNSYAKCFLVQMKVTNQDEEHAKYYKYLQQILCQLNLNFLFTLKNTKIFTFVIKNLIQIFKDIFFVSRL